ncbi:hypothetical protein E8E11_009825 [Didymella keratinophila]|nr:hypothetical protein E8E11_009825 [Didymella keratinophila]
MAGKRNSFLRSSVWVVAAAPEPDRNCGCQVQTSKTNTTSARTVAKIILVEVTCAVVIATVADEVVKLSW